MEGQQEVADAPLPLSKPPLHSLPSPSHDSPSPPQQAQLDTVPTHPALQLNSLTDLTDSDVAPRSHFTRSRLPKKEVFEVAAAPQVEVVQSRRPSSAQKVVRMEVDDPASPQAPPTPTATSPSHSALPLPSFITNSSGSTSDEADSSSDDDAYGLPKPPRPLSFSTRTGLRHIRPSYYFDAEYDPASASAKKRGRRGGMKGIPVFEPTLEEFEAEGGFYGYVKRIEKYGMRAGVVKVVPPKAWSDSLPSTVGPLEAIRLREPIEQHMVGSQGLYRVTNVSKSRIWNPAQWKEMAEVDKWAAPDFLGSKEKGERSERSTKGVGVRAASKGKGKAKVKKVPGDVVLEEDKGEEADTEDGGVRSEVPALTEQDVEMVDAGPIASTFSLPTLRPTASTSVPTASTSALSAASPSPSLGPSVAASTTTSAANSPSKPRAARKKRLTNMKRAEPSLEEWQTFVGTFEELPHGMKKEDYTIDLLREVERRYWRTLTFGEPPMYGADMKGSLFDDSTKAWNVAHLEDLLPKLAPASCKIPGVVSPYLYFGMWRATFAWHVEDADLYSINYIHFGAPKFWYSVPQEMSERFERAMEGLFPTDRTQCSQFLRHKSFLASPRVLANAGITLNRCVQLPGEFMLTYPKGYHSGFNLGFNCAESINFATEKWLPLGRLAKACVCIGDSVNINVDMWLAEAAAAEAGTTIARAPTPSLTAPPSTSTPTSAPRRKRIAVNKDEADEPPRKKVPVVVVEPKVTKKAQMELDKIAKTESFVCALCPDMSSEGLVRIGEPGVRSRKALAAHRVCVMFTPATWIEIDPETEEEIVRGYAGIEKARWKLKCQLCSEKHGTKVQCTKGKCPKAFHVTCALQEDSGVFLDATVSEEGSSVSILDQARAELDAVKTGFSPKDVLKVAIPHRHAPPSPVVAAAVAPLPGTVAQAFEGVPAPVAPGPAVVEDEGIKLTVLCRMHNPVFQQLENARKAAELKVRVDALPASCRLKVRTSGGMFEVTYVGSWPAKEAVAIVFDDGKRQDVKWKNIIWPDSPEVTKAKEDAAAKAKTESIWVTENRPLAPTKRTSAAYSPTPILPFAPYPMAGAYGYYQQPPQPDMPYPTPHGIPPHLQTSHDPYPQPNRANPSMHAYHSPYPPPYPPPYGYPYYGYPPPPSHPGYQPYPQQQGRPWPPQAGAPMPPHFPYQSAASQPSTQYGQAPRPQPYPRSQSQPLPPHLLTSTPQSNSRPSSSTSGRPAELASHPSSPALSTASSHSHNAERSLPSISTLLRQSEPTAPYSALDQDRMFALGMGVGSSLPRSASSDGGNATAAYSHSQSDLGAYSVAGSRTTQGS